MLFKLINLSLFRGLHGFTFTYRLREGFRCVVMREEKGKVFYFGRNIAHFTRPDKISGDQKVEVYALVLVWL